MPHRAAIRPEIHPDPPDTHAVSQRWRTVAIRPRVAHARGWPPELGSRPAPARVGLGRRSGGDARQFLRDTVSAQVDAELDGDIAICDAIRMEVLAGARDEHHLEALRGLLARASVLPAGQGEDFETVDHTEPVDYDEAARLYRRCRSEGETVRRLTGSGLLVKY